MKNEINTKTNYSLNDLIDCALDEFKTNYKEYSDIQDAITEYQIVIHLFIIGIYSNI